MDSVAQQVLMGGVKSTPPGQQVFTTASTNWIVPPGVYSVSVVCVGGGASGRYSGAQSPGGLSSCLGVVAGGADYAGNGGTPSGVFDAGYSGGNSPSNSNPSTGSGGGGAGGYAGNGGNGGNFSNGVAGTGGAGGGGAAFNSDYGMYGGGGGGVGLNGQGSSGAAGTVSQPEGKGGSQGGNANVRNGGLFGGGAMGHGAGRHGGGGALAYRNNIPVTPGQVVTVKVGAGGVVSEAPTSYSGGNGGVRIIWPGNLRQFPSTRTTDE